MHLVWLLILGFLLSGCASLGYKSLEDEVSEQARAQSAMTNLNRKLKQHYETGEQHYKAGQLDQAEVEFKAILELMPEEENALYRMGTLSFKKGQYDAAADYFERAIKVNPRNGKAHYNLASIRLMQAQNHYKYYAALAGKEQDLSNVTTLLGDIDKFNDGGRQTEHAGSLDEIAGALKK